MVGGVVLVILLLGVTSSGLPVTPNPEVLSNSIMDSGAGLNAKFQYSIIQDHHKEFVTSSIAPFNKSFVRLTTKFVASQSHNAIKASSFLAPLNSLEFTIQKDHQQFVREPNQTGTFIVTRKANNDSNGMISYSFLKVENALSGENYTLVVRLLETSGRFIPTLIHERMSGRYYFFVPQLLPPNVYSNSSGGSISSQVITPPPGGGYLGGQLRLNEMDNKETNYNVWYQQVGLTVYSFNEGSSGWSSSFSAVADSPIGNWNVVGSTGSVSQDSVSLTITGTLTASYNGWFPYGEYDAWKAMCTIYVKVSLNGGVTGQIENTIWTWNGLSGSTTPIVWYSGVLFNGYIIGGQITITQYIVN